MACCFYIICLQSCVWSNLSLYCQSLLMVLKVKGKALMFICSLLLMNWMSCGTIGCIFFMSLQIKCSNCVLDCYGQSMTFQHMQCCPIGVPKEHLHAQSVGIKHVHAGWNFWENTATQLTIVSCLQITNSVKIRYHLIGQESMRLYQVGCLGLKLHGM